MPSVILMTGPARDGGVAWTAVESTCLCQTADSEGRQSMKRSFMLLGLLVLQFVYRQGGRCTFSGTARHEQKCSREA